MSLQALIFDVDGTLAETEEIHRDAFNRTFREAGLTWHWDQALYGRLLKVTGGKERIRHYVASHAIGDFPAEDAARIANLHARKNALYAQLMQDGEVQLRPGVQALIEQAHGAGMRLAIATTTSLPNVETLLRATLGETGLRYFEVIAAGDTVVHKKPAPDIYLQALAQLRLPAGECLAIEDSHNGLRSALAAGIQTLVVTSAYTQEEEFPGAALVLDSLDTLAGSAPTILDALRSLHRGARQPQASA